MGSAMAKHLVSCNVNLVLYNRTLSKAEEVVASLSTSHPDAPAPMVCGSPAQAVSDSPIVVLMVSDFRAASAVLGLLPEKSLEGKVVLMMSTLGPDESKALFESVTQDLGGVYVEAPVLGSVPQASSGNLEILLGGDEVARRTLEARSDVMDLLSAMGRPRVVGSLGQAPALKLALNSIILASTASLSVAIGMVTGAGLSPSLLMDVLSGSILDMPYFGLKINRMVQGDFSQAAFPLSLMLKDARLITKYAGSVGVRTDVVLEPLVTVVDNAVAAGLGPSDFSAIHSLISPRAQSL